MGQIRVDVGGRSYPLACKDGDEPLIGKLAATVDAKAQQLTAQLGHLPEVRLLLMSAIMIADDLVRGGTGEREEAEDRAAAALADAADKVEQLTAALEAKASGS